MLRRTLIALTLLTSLALAGGPAFAADPTLHEVYQAAEAGNYREAQAMMDQVLRDHPNSAKAHFVEAELLAKQGRLSEAKGELATAERLEPGLSFAKAGAVEELKGRLASSYAVRQPATFVPAAAAGFPWGSVLLVVGLLALVVLVVRMLRARSPSAVQGAAAPSYGAGSAAGQPYGYGGMGRSARGGVGSGILGGLAGRRCGGRCGGQRGVDAPGARRASLGRWSGSFGQPQIGGSHMTRPTSRRAATISASSYVVLGRQFGRRRRLDLIEQRPPAKPV
jgi:hypothetical protein